MYLKLMRHLRILILFPLCHFCCFGVELLFAIARHLDCQAIA